MHASRLILIAAIPLTFLAGLGAARLAAPAPVTAASTTPVRPAIDAEIAKLTESMYVARQLDVGEVEAARDYLALSMDLDILALAEQLDALSPQRRAAALSVLAEIHEYRENYPSTIETRGSDRQPAFAAMRADVEAVLERAAALAPAGRLQF
ncbi:MAG: hypothetical protein ABF271_02155 [Abyssibacter sp.]|uniref:hypothetical protein n=1 Tax=Abyssibacter sp. TaxID=2320200 RepID=UPI00321AB505